MFDGNVTVAPELESGTEGLARLVEERLELEAAMREILALERRLRNLTGGSEDLASTQLTPITLPQLQDRFGFVDWHGFLNKAFAIIKHDLGSEVVVLVSESYLDGLQKLVEEMSAAPETLAILHNYLAWRLVAQFYPSKYRDEARRGEQCLKQTEDVFGPVSEVQEVLNFHSSKQ